MPKYLTLALPLLYAVTGGFLWYAYGAETLGLILWVLLQVVIVFIYKWLIADRSLGLMLKFHLIAMGIGMLILFFVLFPGRVQQHTDQLIVEFFLMAFGTFCCAVGVFSLLYMVVRKLIADNRKA